MKRTVWMTVCTAMLCLMAVSVQAQTIGTVVGLQGQAVIERGGTESPLSLSAKVELNDRILTRSGAKLQILFDDDSVLALGENSEAVIDEYVYNPTEKKDNSFGASFGKGIFRLITGKITDLNPDRFKVKTARSSIGIRGCELGFLIDEDADRILLIRIPGGRQIIIGPAGQQLKDARVFPRAGRMITIFDNGRMQVEEIPPGEAGKIFGDTSPGASDGEDEESGGSEDGSSGNADDDQGFSGSDEGESSQSDTGNFDGPDDQGGADEQSPQPESERQEALQENNLRDESEEATAETPLRKADENDSGEDEQGGGGTRPEPEPEPEPEPGPEPAPTPEPVHTPTDPPGLV
ncbi:MAG: FecR domain-containing protein, partial [Kiritimatiellia bacterium]